MNNDLMQQQRQRIRLLLVVKLTALAIITVLLFTVIYPIAINQATYKVPIEYLDEKMATATKLSLGTTSASLLVSGLPDDLGTPIADELAEFSGYLLLVISAIFLERYLLTTIGFISSAVILPLSILFAAAAVFAHPENKMKYKEYAFRLLIFGICILLIIPLGCICGSEIERANAKSIEMALNDAEDVNEIIESLPEKAEEKNVLDKVGEFFSGIWKSATDGYEWAKTVLTNFMSSVAVMLVTTIAIPVLIVFCFLWMIKFLTKHDFVVAVVGFADQFISSTKNKLRGTNRNNCSVE